MELSMIESARNLKLAKIKMHGGAVALFVRLRFHRVK